MRLTNKGDAHGVAARGNAWQCVSTMDNQGRLRNILFFDNCGAYFIEYIFYSWYLGWNYLIGCVFVVWKRRHFVMMRCIIITKLHLSMLV